MYIHQFHTVPQPRIDNNLKQHSCFSTHNYIVFSPGVIVYDLVNILVNNKGKDVSIYMTRFPHP